MLDEAPFDAADINRLNSNIMTAVDTAIEKIVNIQERDIPFTVDLKSASGILTSSIPATVFSEDRIGAIAQT